jgi:hypothetical protein
MNRGYGWHGPWISGAIMERWMIAIVVACAVLGPAKAEAQTDVAPAEVAESVSAPQAYTLDEGAAAQHRGLRFTEAEARTKVRRLRIAGWAILSTGALLLFPGYLIDVSVSAPALDDYESGRRMARYVYLYGFAAGALVMAGGAMLLRARLIQRRHRRAHEAHSDLSLAAAFTGQGAAMTLRF